MQNPEVKAEYDALQPEYDIIQTMIDARVQQNMTQKDLSANTMHKKWEKIHHRLQALEAADQEQEAEILKKAYECLLCAYQESRALNDEMDMLVKDALTS